MAKLWDKGIELDQQIEAFTVGDDYVLDQELVYYDCLASKAHAKMLVKAGLLGADESDLIKQELDNIIQLHAQEKFSISRTQEDCHTAIEEHLVSKLGDVGKKIHTARSRNDQVLTALRLYYKDNLQGVAQLNQQLQESLSGFVNAFGSIAYPGYTHMQKAMPSSFALWGSAFIDGMQDNATLLDAIYKIIDQSPLGTAAGYGVPLDIDRQLTADELGFSSLQENPIYTQYSRGKFEVMLIHGLSQITADLNKMANDLIMFNMQEFAFVKLPDQFCTGSSIMPQKKNPDVLELLRAKHHVVTACEYQVTNIVSNLISGYNRDLQLTKEPVMKAFKITIESMQVADLLIRNLKVDQPQCEKAMSTDLFATEKAYELVKQGVPFRDAYQQVARSISGKK